MKSHFEKYREIWLIDFEFQALPGEKQDVICMVGHEQFSGRVIRLWADQLARLSTSPFETGDDVLVVAYFASAEMGCFLSLGWPLPCNVLDLYVEFRNMTNGKGTIGGNGLLGALQHFGEDGIEHVEKTEMRDLAIRGGPYTESEKLALLDYCESDVLALKRLLPHLSFKINWPQALMRGRYMQAVSMMEWYGIPIDIVMLAKLRQHWNSVKEKLVRTIDDEYRVYEGISFSSKRFADYVDRNGISWPRLMSGKLALDDETFKSMSKSFPQLTPLRELRRSLGTMRSFDLPVGKDGYNRCLLSPFSAKTSRNQPSTTKFPFGLPAWMRSFIQPKPGRSLAYIDWSQQEFGIAAALSGDEAMMEAYRSGDPYLTFARQAGAVPHDATKESHKNEREQYKQCALAVQYGMGERTLAARLGKPQIEGYELLQKHKRTYHQFWRWSEGAVNCGLFGRPLQTVFGWTLNPTSNPNPLSLANFPVQANGAEMLRLAIILATEQGVRVCAPIHDAVLIEAPTGQIEASVNTMQLAMAEASRIILRNLELRSDVKYIHSPDRYMDERGVEMWDRVVSLITEIEENDTCVS